MSDSQAAFRISPQQEGLWAVAPAGPAGRTQAILTVDGPFTAEALNAAVGRVVERHEVLRTTFTRRPGIRVPLQVVHDVLAPAWGSEDLRGLEPAAREARLQELAGEELGAALHLEQGPLVRVRHAALQDERHALVITASDLCLDAASVAPLAAELAAQLGGDVELPAEPLQYADYAEWQHELATGEDDAAQAGRRFWAECEGLRATEPPFRTAGAGAPAEAEVPYDADLAASVRAAAQHYGVDAETVVQAAWHALLARLTATEDVVTALVDGGPRRDHLDGLLGPTARPVPVRTAVSASTTFAELVARVQRSRTQALTAEDYGSPGPDDVLRVGMASSASFQAAPLRVDALTAATGPGLWLVCHDLAGTPQLRLVDDAPGGAEALTRLAGRLARLLRSAAGDPGTTVGRLALLSEEERHELLVGVNDTATAAPAESLQDRFGRHVAANADALAVQDGVTSLTYGELATRADAVAAHLRDLGVQPGEVVALCTDRSADMVVALMGILTARAAFLPLHFEHPRARLSHQLTETGCRVVLTQRALLARLPADGPQLVCVDEPLPAAAAAGEPPAVAAADLAYVIYTSGSTGRPKGVGVTNANLANYVDHLVRWLDAEARPLRFGMVTALSTDLGHTAVFGALGSGGTLTLIAPAEAADGPALARRLERTPVDVLKITPSHLGALLAGDDPRVLPQRWLIVGGERLGWDLVERVRGLGGCTVVNHYGPTETTIGSCMLTVGEGPGPDAPSSVPIGRPIANTRCYLLDELGEPVAVGTPGALFVAGAGVAAGYVGHPELTAERFCADPFAADGGRMYDTGDQARRLPDGTIEYLGRADEQVKIRGFRVEPGEVEEALRTHAGVREAVVVVREGPNGTPRLVAYTVQDAALRDHELQDHLADLVPDYMVPASFVSLDALPRTPSGKIDRQALPAPSEGGDDDGHVAPRTELEQAVAGIWAQVLGVERVGVEDDFFALGGHSLLAAQVVAQIRSDFAVELPMHSLFMIPTVAALSAEIARMMQAVDADETEELLATLEGLSDDEVEQMLAEQPSLDES